MIALVRLPEPGRAARGLTSLDVLPDAPACAYTAFAVRCRDDAAVVETLAWYGSVLAARPEAPLGLVAHERDCVQAVARFGHALVFVLEPEALEGERLPASALTELREAGIEGRLMEELAAEYGAAVDAEPELLRALVARAVAGSTLARAARDAGVHRDTFARRLRGVGLDPRLLRQEVRARGYQLRVELGVEPRTALEGAGWADHEQRRKAMVRLRDR